MKRMKREEVFEYLAPGWKWIAMDGGGDWFVHAEKPRRKWESDSWEGSIYEWCAIAIDYDGPWEDSLTKRPREKIFYSVPSPAQVIMFSENHAPVNAIHSFNEAPPEVADWYHRIMEESK